MKYEIHPTAAIFPMMADSALNELAADIKEHGLRDPIVMYEGKVLDGRNRLEACHRAGVDPTFIEWEGTGSVVSWIVSVNLHRRHLTYQQRAMIAAKVAIGLTVEGKKRRARNLRNSVGPLENLDPDFRHPSDTSVDLAANNMNISRDATSKAIRVIKHGSDELMQAVNNGRASLDAAAQVTKLPKAKQSELVAQGKVVEGAKEIREEKPKNEPEEPPSLETQKPNDFGGLLENLDPDFRDKVEPSPEEILLSETHAELDKMFKAAQKADRLESITKQLRGLIAHCLKMQGQYNGDISN
jgi:hypothetical protein